MANQNCFREISDKFNVSISTAHDSIMKTLEQISDIAEDYIKWPTNQEKQTSAGVFKRITDIDNVIGAIDGCHIKIQKPPGCRGEDYINRKSYYSILLQGICDDEGRLLDVFIGPPGKVHDARMLRKSDFFMEWQAKMAQYFLLGDSAYISRQFPFIKTPRRDNGNLTDEERAQNTKISRGRVIIENVYGRMKCRWRRIRDLQNVNLVFMCRIVMAACVLHNFCMDELCEEHPNGCPREEFDPQ